MKSDHQTSDLEDALRGDLPTAEDSARVRARLAAVGVLAVSATAGSVAGAATVGAEGLSLGARMAALSWGTKLAVVSAVSVGVGMGAVATVKSAGSPKPSASVTTTANAGRRIPAAPVKPVVATTAAMAAPTVEASNVTVPQVSQLPAPVEKRRVFAPAVSAARVVSAPSAPTAVPENAPSNLGFPTDTNSRANATTLREERALVDAALLAMSSGDRRRAAALLDAHAAKFPNGLLRLERERARSKLEVESQ